MTEGVRVSAPGKMMLSGEYAVLQGAPAVVAAVDRRAYARVGAAAGGQTVASPEAEAARGEAERVLGAVDAALRLDARQLRAERRKLGLGSSAALAAASAGVVFAYHGADLGDVVTRQAVFDAALDGHRAVAPEGSGADVAAAVFGGFLRYELRPDRPAIAPLEWPEDVCIRVVWTRSDARTSDLVRAVNRLAERDRSLHAERMGELSREASRFAAAVVERDVTGLLEAARAYGLAMAELGRAAGAPIVTPALHHVAALADSVGGAAKPSGAGGGDVAVAFFACAEDAVRFERHCDRDDLALLDLHLGAPGVRVEAT